MILFTFNLKYLTKEQFFILSVGKLNAQKDPMIIK